MSLERRVTPGAIPYYPAYVVWELTLNCDHACQHCGSRAFKPREHELNTEEALAVVEQLRSAATREVVLIGGEAYLHSGFLAIIQALHAAGIRVNLTTGGRGITAELAQAAAKHGLDAVSVSIDGLEESHDRIRARHGSFQGALAALQHFAPLGVQIGSNINVNRLNMADLESLYDILCDAGIAAWQIQITTPLGRAADHPDMILQPYDLLELMPRIARLKERARNDGILIMPGNNLGYFGPEEALLRSYTTGDRDHWQGCQAGKYVMGIESHGAVKGCPSLQASYVGGNLREHSLAEIWADTKPLAFARARTREDLWGFCRECPFADTCLAGCTFTAHALFGKPGNNPYCHFRARTLAKRGVRESVRLVTRAPGMPFDHGLFEIVEEKIRPDIQ
jgi:radical SAM protein with 4Fe4S-binding SPASM domain